MYISIIVAGQSYHDYICITCHDLDRSAMIWLWFVQEGPERISKGHFAHELMDSWMPMDAMVNPRGSTKKIQVLVIFHYCPLVNKQFTSLLWKITTMFFLWGFIHYFDWAICSTANCKRLPGRV